jgi:calcineurin-like phosphoesterase family protein
MASSLDVSVDSVLTDVDYIVSDLHFNHQNIIKYCRDRYAPTQSGLDDMNWELLANWNQTVASDDVVVFVGDFAWYHSDDQDPITQRKVDNLWETLNGQKIFVRGDHDHVIPSSADTDRYTVEIRHDGESFFVSHFPGDTPESLSGGGMPERFQENLPVNVAERCDCWRIHGHHHNNWPDVYPLSNPERQTINCSVELTDYRPLSMEEVDRIVAQEDWIHSV